MILKPTTRRQPKVREDVRWVILIWNLFEINGFLICDVFINYAFVKK